MLAAEMTTLEIADLAANAVFILPVAAIEQHGPHLPIGTDWMLGSRVAADAERQRPDRIVLYPAIPVGSSDHHRPFAGTLTLRADHYTDMLVDLTETMIGWGARRICLLNSHGGNMTPGKQALNLVAARRPHDVWCVMTSYFDLAGSAFAGDPPMETDAVLSHACEYETSMMQIVAPQLVHMDRYTPQTEPPDNKYIGWHDERPSPIAYGAMTEWITSNGVSGDPRPSTPEKGEHLLRAAADALVRFVDDFATWPFPRDMRDGDA
jgi:creatinine amidohydrolase